MLKKLLCRVRSSRGGLSGHLRSLYYGGSTVFGAFFRTAKLMKLSNEIKLIRATTTFSRIEREFESGCFSFCRGALENHSKTSLGSSRVFAFLLLLRSQ